MKIIYVCEICGEQYDTERKAVNCETQQPEPAAAEVGDIISGKAGYGWFDGDERWVSNPTVKENRAHGNCFGSCCAMAFYYVVTKITFEGHRRKYHLFTNAMTGKQGHRNGYTYDRDHIEPEKTKNPPAFVVQDSKKLIGRKAEALL